MVIRPLIAFFALVATASGQIVPAPQHADFGKASVITGQIVHCDAPEFERQVDAFVAALRKIGVPDAARTDSDKAAVVIRFVKNDSLPPAGYTITSGDAFLTVSASSAQGAAHAAASLLQTVTLKGDQAAWPQMKIEDHPDRPYRSFMIDMGRNPHSPATLRQVVDMMWFYKANHRLGRPTPG